MDEPFGPAEEGPGERRVGDKARAAAAAAEPAFGRDEAVPAGTAAESVALELEGSTAAAAAALPRGAEGVAAAGADEPDPLATALTWAEAERALVRSGGVGAGLPSALEDDAAAAAAAAAAAVALVGREEDVGGIGGGRPLEDGPSAAAAPDGDGAAAGGGGRPVGVGGPPPAAVVVARVRRDLVDG